MFDSSVSAIDYAGLIDGVSIGLEPMDILSPQISQNVHNQVSGADLSLIVAGKQLNDLTVNNAASNFATAGDSLDSLTGLKVGEAISVAQGLLTQFASSSDFTEKLGLAFGLEFDQGVGQSIKQKWANDDFSELPDIKIISSEILGEANGAFAASTNTIYLSKEFVLDQDLGSIVSVILEETGHSVDSQINRFDSSGDEGDIFSRVVQGKTISQEDWSVLKTEDDSGAIVIDGVEVAIEKNVVFYEHGGYRGRSITLREGNYSYVGSNWNDIISSIGISQGFTVEAYENANFQGKRTVFSSSTSYVGNNWNDKISSLRINFDRAGNSFYYARNLGTLTDGYRSYSDWVGSGDSQDYYRFYLDRPTTRGFVLQLNNLREDADVELLDVAGNLITRSQQSSNNSEYIWQPQLSAGTYYVRVYPYGGANTNYTLSLTLNSRLL